MKKLIYITILITAFLGFNTGFALANSENNSQEYALVVPLGSIATQSSSNIQNSLNTSGIKYFDSITLGDKTFHYYKNENFVLKKQSVIKKLTDLQKDSYAYQVPNFRLHRLPSDPIYPLQAQYFNNINLSQAWDFSTGSKSVKIGILDADFNLPIPDLDANHSKHWQDSKPCLLPRDKVTHGSLVSQVIGANTNNNIGIAGVNWTSSLLTYEVACGGNISEVLIGKAIAQALQDKPDVINFSFGASLDTQADFDYYRDNSLFGRGIKELEKARITLVAASGNCNQKSNACPVAKTADFDIPSAIPYVISVGAVNKSGQVSSFSQRGQTLDLVAPGEGIIVSKDAQFVSVNGTSFASPIVTGVIGLIKALRPSISSDEIKSLLYSTAQDIGAPGRDNDSGFGLIDVYATLCKLTNCTTQKPPPACPYLSTQVRVQKDSSNPWLSELNLKSPQVINMAVFHNNTGQFATDPINFKIQEPNGRVKNFDVDKQASTLSISEVGTYLITASSKAREGENYSQKECQDSARVILDTRSISNTPIPSPTNTIIASNTPVPTFTPSPSIAPISSSTPTLSPSLSPTLIPPSSPTPTLSPTLTSTLTPSLTPTPSACKTNCQNTKCPNSYVCVSDQNSSFCYHPILCPAPDILLYCANPSPSISPFIPTNTIVPVSSSPIPSIITQNPLPSSIPSFSPSPLPSNTPSITPTPTINYCARDCQANSPFCGEGFYCHADGNTNKCYNFTNCLAPGAPILCEASPSPIPISQIPISSTPSTSITPDPNLPNGCFQKCTQDNQCSVNQKCISYPHNCSKEDPNYPDCGYCYANNCLPVPTGAPLINCPAPYTPTPIVSQASQNIATCTFRAKGSIFLNENGQVRPYLEINKNNTDWYLYNDAQQKIYFPEYQKSLETGGENIFGFTAGSQYVNLDPVNFPLFVKTDDKRFPYQKGDQARLILNFPKDHAIESVFCLDQGQIKACPENLPQSPSTTNTPQKSLNGIKLDCGANLEYGYVLKKVPANDLPKETLHNLKFDIKNNTPTSISTELFIKPCDAINCHQGFTVQGSQIYEGSADNLSQSNYTVNLQLPSNSNFFVKITSCPGQIQNPGTSNESCSLNMDTNKKISWQICSNANCLPSSPTNTQTPVASKTSWYRCDDSRANPRCCQCTLGVCAVDNLVKYFRDDSSRGGKSARQKAIEASVICSRESGCNTSRNKSPEGYPLNNACLSSGSCDYSVGPFQINLLLRCNSGIRTQCNSVPMCVILDNSKLAQCRREFGSDSGSIQKMLEISQNGTNWRPWASKSVCNIP